MNRKAFWLWLSFLIVITTLISSCSNTSTSTSTTMTSISTTMISTSTTMTSTSTTATTATTATTTTPATTAAAGTPTYGGTLGYFGNFAYETPSDFDAPMSAMMSAVDTWVEPYLQFLIVADINTYGPQGNNAYSFTTWEFVPEQYETGELATSWQIATNGSGLTYTFNIRHNVMWTGNTKMGMASRPLTAYDIASSLQRNITRPGFASSFTWINSITATDNYTVVWSCNSFFANWPWRIGGGTALGLVYAPETIAAGPQDWRNAVGTGPYILTDYVQGSEATYTRNPNYWDTTTINGKSYQLPFIDKVIFPIIPDSSTQMAALRTGKLDWDPKVTLINQSSLTSSAPSLVQTKYLGNTVEMLKFNRLTSAYFTDRNLRAALMIGTDLNSLNTMEYGAAETVSWPLSPNIPGFTPLAKLPAADQQLYSYNPTLAKQMITTEGYPNGFSMVITCQNDTVSEDLASACVTMWAKIGVKASIKLLDATGMASVNEYITYPDCETYLSTVANPLTSLGLVRSDTAGATYKTGEPMMAEDVAALATIDPVQRTAIEQKLGVDFLDDVGVLPFGNAYLLNCYWPWLKNYYGELEAGYYNGIPMIQQMWIDPTMKPQ